MHRLLVTLAALLCAVSAQAAPGDIDPSFGSSGTTTVSGSNGESGYPAAIVRDSTDRLYLLMQYGNIGTPGGPASPGLNYQEILRYSANGVLDTSFGNGGRLSVDANGSYQGFALDEAGGRFVLTGNIFEWATVVRISMNGTPDAAFGTVILPTFLTSVGNNVAIDTSGNIYVSGTHINGASVFVAKLKPDGTIDSSYAGSGLKSAISSGGRSSDVMASTIDGSGNLLTCGPNYAGTPEGIAYLDAGVVVGWLTPDGSAVNGYGESGFAEVDMDGRWSCAAIKARSSGFSVAAYNPGYLSIARFTNTGLPDTAFNGNGRLTSPLPASFLSAPHAVIQRDGKLVLAGFTSSLTPTLMRVAGSSEFADTQTDTESASGGGGALQIGWLLSLLAAGWLRHRLQATAHGAA